MTDSSHSSLSRVLSIQSHVVSGYVGNKSATFPLQVLGFDVDAINSVQFSNHTGYPVVKGQILNANDLHDVYGGLKSNGINRYSHLLTGYIGSKSFLLAVRDVILDLKATNPDLIYVCDPVLGDLGKLYVPEELLPVYRESILPLADIITPNQFEAELLTGIKITDLESARAAMARLHEMGSRTVVISSSELLSAPSHDSASNPPTGSAPSPGSAPSTSQSQPLVCLASRCADDSNGKPKTFLQLDIPRFPMDFTGSGDLFAALLLVWTLRHPDDLKLACEKVVSTLQAVLRRTMEFSKEALPNDGTSTVASRELRLIQSRADIEHPTICVHAVILP